MGKDSALIHSPAVLPQVLIVLGEIARLSFSWMIFVDMELEFVSVDPFVLLRTRAT